MIVNQPSGIFSKTLRVAIILVGVSASRSCLRPQEIQLRQICHFFRADPAYGIGVAQALGIDLAEFMPNGVQLEAVAEKQ